MRELKNIGYDEDLECDVSDDDDRIEADLEKAYEDLQEVTSASAAERLSPSATTAGNSTVWRKIARKISGRMFGGRR